MVLGRLVWGVERGKVKFLRLLHIFMHMAINISIANTCSLGNRYKRQHEMGKTHDLSVVEMTPSFKEVGMEI